MKFPKVKKSIGYGVLGLVGVLGVILIISATQKNSSKRCKGLQINIANNTEQYLVTKDDIEKTITRFGNEPVEGKIIENIDLSKIEKRVLESGYAKKCEAYTNLQGQLVVDIEPYKPIARVLDGYNHEDYYLDEDGDFFPTSKHFSQTVMILNGDFFRKTKNLKSEKNKELLEFIKYLTEDEFWEAQITQVNINASKEINLIPLLGQQIIEFGKVNKYQSKLNKLMVFYEKILPEKEWSQFSKISLKYDSQIVCN